MQVAPTTVPTHNRRRRLAITRGGETEPQLDQRGAFRPPLGSRQAASRRDQCRSFCPFSEISSINASRVSSPCRIATCVAIANPTSAIHRPVRSRPDAYESWRVSSEPGNRHLTAPGPCSSPATASASEAGFWWKPPENGLRGCRCFSGPGRSTSPQPDLRPCLRPHPVCRWLYTGSTPASANAFWPWRRHLAQHPHQHTPQTICKCVV
jgi:hypothetical protein